MALKTKLIVNATRGDALCVGILADSPLLRMRGLMGRRGLPAGEGLLIRPAPGIHTAFMRFPIDALFLDGDLRVLDVVERLGPWRMASRRRARAVLELAAGEVARCGVEVGDRLSLHERKPVVSSPGSGVPATACASSQSIIWPTPAPDSEQASVSPMRVLVVSSDRHFRSVTSMLLAHRGCTVTSAAEPADVSELIDRDHPSVVVIDAEQPSGTRALAAVRALAHPVGIVVVGQASSGSGARPNGNGRPALEKWGPLEDLYAAIERAAKAQAGRGETR